MHSILVHIDDLRRVLALLVFVVVVSAAKRLDAPPKPRASLLQRRPLAGDTLRETPPSRLSQRCAHALPKLLNLALQEGVD